MLTLVGQVKNVGGARVSLGYELLCLAPGCFPNLCEKLRR